MAREEDDGLVNRELWSAACGEVLKTTMAELRMSIYYIAQKTGLPYSTTVRYLNGERAPSLFAAKLICDFLGITVDHFMKRAMLIYEGRSG
jgi:transcriptional regulator with XRE-family HTH domain